MNGDINISTAKKVSRPDIPPNPKKTAPASVKQPPAEQYAQKKFRWVSVMILVSLFQLISFSQVLFKEDTELSLYFILWGYILFEWAYLFFAHIVTEKSNFQLDIIALFLSGIGLLICGTRGAQSALNQFIAIVLGIAVYTVVLIVIKNPDVAMFLRSPIAVAAVLALAATRVIAKETNGAFNWINIGSFSLQPAELVKIAFVYVGAATLDKLQNTRSLTKYIIFAFGCIGMLFLMRDFGAALIFFFSFIIMAFMRSGDIRTLILICAAALIGAFMIIYFKPYVANRFSEYRHIWDDMLGKGYQQTRALIYSASGGLFGIGIGEGWMRKVFAATTDCVFALVCEEMGMIIGFSIIICFLLIGVYAVKGAMHASSTFYAIAAVAAAGMIIFQAALNVFGVTDLLPLTGVTLPFISRGGSSLMCVWGLLAFIKSLDYRYHMEDDTKAVRK